MTTMLATEDPAIAVAMGLCLAARVVDEQRRVTARHPRPCGWCDYPTTELDVAVREFNEWAGFDDRRSTSGRHATRAFAELRADKREALIVAAQAFDPMPTVEPPAPDAAAGSNVLEDPSWAH